MQRSYDYRHIVTFEDANLTGNVYYVNHLRWQGQCRERFLRELVPELLNEMREGLSLVTTRCSCEFLGELAAFDVVDIQMRLKELVQNRATLAFDYLRISEGREELVARGEQQVACMRRDGDRLSAAPFPERMVMALQSYRPAGS